MLHLSRFGTFWRPVMTYLEAHSPLGRTLSWPHRSSSNPHHKAELLAALQFLNPKRCPAWCDRVLMNPATLELVNRAGRHQELRVVDSVHTLTTVPYPLLPPLLQAGWSTLQLFSRRSSPITIEFYLVFSWTEVHFSQG